MNIVKIKPHLTTTNLYVQLSIVNENLKNIESVISCFRLKNMCSIEYRECFKLKEKQNAIKKSLLQKIKSKEQISFSFGGFSSSL